MDKKSFLQAGHTPTLIAAFLYFDLAFMVWVLLGPLAVGIAADLGLSHAQKGLMVATPVLAGAILRRLVMGVVVDRLSPKKAAIIGQLIVIGALAYAWVAGVHSFNEVLVLGVFLGVAGASFAAALPLASRWYPPEHQGTAMGIAGAGNSGTAFAALFAPGLAMAFGWHKRVRAGADSAGDRAGGLLLHGQGRARRAAAQALRRVPGGAQGQGRVVVHVLLRGHLWRLRRPGLVAGDRTSTPSTGWIRRWRAISPRPACSPVRWCARLAATWPIASAG